LKPQSAHPRSVSKFDVQTTYLYLEIQTMIEWSIKYTTEEARAAGYRSRREFDEPISHGQKIRDVLACPWFLKT
jgi:hypothetical protein